MARQGLNTTLSYQRGKERRAYQVRANLITHGVTILSDESASRIRKAFYPHRLTSAQFTIGIQLKGDEEYRSFSSWMANYVDYLLDPNLAFEHFPIMTVSVPSQKFERDGVPLSGFEWGDHVGAMVWEPQVVFESGGERGVVPRLSHVEGIREIADKSVQYFYPTGIQLSGDQAPPNGSYDRIVTMQDIDNMLGKEQPVDDETTETLPNPFLNRPVQPTGPGPWSDPST